jgi:hypothetical protein
MHRLFISSILTPFLLVSCFPQKTTPTPVVDREHLIPSKQIKIKPENDLYPVQSLTDEYENPVPLPYPVNTAGAEDSAFITPDGNTLFVWFTPDVNKPAEAQLNDGATGIYEFQKIEGGWSQAERIWLIDPGKAALDGCEFASGNVMWFCSVREGYTGLHWFTAENINGEWENWKNADFNPEYEVGELHFTSDGKELYFHSNRPGGYGGYDIWVSRLKDGIWGFPENVSAVNSPYTDGWPFVSQDGLELWFTRAIGAPELYRSIRVNGEWAEPEKMFSLFSGEASLDNRGNVYFTHHYYKDDIMLESDIYVAKKK